MENSKFTYKEMQDNLPDYLFGRISVSDKIKFESTLPDFPDIKKEIADVEEVFQKFEKTDINRTLAQKSRNISVKVNKRLTTSTQRQSKFRFFFRFAMPTIAVVFLAFFIMGDKNPFSDFGFDKKQSILITQSDNEDKEFFTDLERELILEKVVEEEITEKESINTNLIIEEEMIADLIEISSDLEEIYNEEMLKQILNETDVLIDYLDTHSYTHKDFIYSIDNMDEEDFQFLIEELSDDKILS